MIIDQMTVIKMLHSDTPMTESDGVCHKKKEKKRTFLN